MKTRAAVAAIGIVVWAIGCVPMTRAGDADAQDRDQAPLRLVSLAPSITETLFALGAGAQLQGVTDYCDFPAAARILPKGGGYYDPRNEAILGLRPDVGLLLIEHRDAAQRFRRLGVPVLAVEMHSLAGLVTTYQQLGALCRAEARGAMLLRELMSALGQGPARQRPGPNPRVLLVVSRDHQAAGFRETYIAGRGEFYDELLELAGAQNAYRRRWPKYPKLAAEGLLSLDPDVIVELVADPAALSRPLDSLAADWQQLPGLRAVQAGRVFVLAGAYTVRPGPRLPLLLEDLRRAVGAGKERE
jgi:iron complex transport system substrate-binding protein